MSHKLFHKTEKGRNFIPILWSQFQPNTKDSQKKTSHIHATKTTE